MSTIATPTTISQPASTLQPPEGSGSDWVRVEYGVAAAYILHKEGRAVLIDTGARGSATAIADELTGIGLTWADIEHIILTHSDRDNVGGLTEVAALAENAQIWAGDEDIDDMPPVDGKAIRPVSESERIFDLTVIFTPGPTPGHISVLDEASGFLVDGDLIAVRRGEIFGPSLATSSAVEQARQSMRKLATYEFERILVARGEPITADGSEIMSAVAAMSGS